MAGDWFREPPPRAPASGPIGVGALLVPGWRGSAVGTYRCWRDSGYVVGASLAGALPDRFGMAWAFGGVALRTRVSGLVVLARMPGTGEAF